MEQTVYLGSTTTDVVVYTQAIDSSGTHVALSIDTSTTKLVFSDGTVSSATPTVASLGTGKAKVTFASISNSSLSAGDKVAVRLNGEANSVQFSEYMISVFIATASSGGGGSSLTQADIRTAVGLASANLDTQLSDIPTVSEFNARTKPTADYFDHTADQVAVSAVNDKTGYSLATAPPTASEIYAEFTSGSNEDVFKADVSQLSTFNSSTDQVVASNMRGTDNAFLAANAPTNFAALSINSSGHIARVTLVDTTTSNTDQRGTDNALLASAAPANWGSLLINGSGHIGRVVLVDTTTTNSDMVDISSVALASDLAAVDNVVDAIKVKTDQMVFSVSGQIDANALTGGGGASAADVYTYFVAGSNADALKADVTSLASQASVDTVDGVVDAIKVKTDQLTFTTPNSVDATATASVDESAIANAVLAGIGGNDVTISSPVASDGTTITIVRGDDYNASDTRAITWTGDSDDQWPDLTDATLKFTAKNNLDSMTITPTITQPTGSQAFRMELTKDDTEILSGRYKYDVQATLSSGRVITLVVGEMIVKQTYTCLLYTSDAADE